MQFPDNNITGYKKVDIHYGVQTVFSTIPNQKNIDFEEDVERNYFESYKSNIDEKDGYLYSPLKYYMLGDYDVCYISLINNFKFSHRLFEPKDKTDDTVYNAHSFQSFSGFALNEIGDLKKLFTPKTIPPYFIGVINLKLNNGLLIGNGIKYIESVYNYLSKILGDMEKPVPFLLTQTFSWFELSLSVFVNDPKELSDILSKIRMSKFKHLIEDAHSLTDSLYHTILKGKDKKILENTSLFADTNTFFGFNKYLIQSPLKEQYVKDFLKHIKSEKINLESEIEWQVKPGHILELEKLLATSEHLAEYFNFEDRKVVLGKCDYLLQEVGSDIRSNFHLIRHIHRKDSCSLYDHIRKVRTYIFLDGKKFGATEETRKDFFCWDKELDRLAVKSRDFNDIDKKLKTLKISRQVRIKILKIFSNYNNGIQDPIQFPYFLDFTIFIKNLTALINDKASASRTEVTSIKELETTLNEHIKIFQEGYNVRFLNGYQFENISDFDLDFNSSIQQLLTTYGTLVYEYGKLFYKNSEILYGPLIQLNNIDTTSNYLSINYSIHHLTSPEFVFSTLLKEILNHLRLDNKKLGQEFKNFDEQIDDNFIRINESYLDDMRENHLIDFDYMIIDSIRFLATFNGDFKLFEHWFWSYNFQNPSLFDTSGMFNEEHLRKEMLRILLIKYIFEVKESLVNPTPELFTYWDRHFKKIDKIAIDLSETIKKFEFIDIINGVIFNYLNNFKGTEKASPKFYEYMTKLEVVKNVSAEVHALQRKKLSLLFSDSSDSGLGIIDMEKLLFNTLNDHFINNGKKVTLLKRNWDTGKIIQTYNLLNKDISYAIDQTGGVFFYEKSKINDYFRENARCILSLINFSLIKKKSFILEQRNDE